MNVFMNEMLSNELAEPYMKSINGNAIEQDDHFTYKPRNKTNKFNALAHGAAGYTRNKIKGDPTRKYADLLSKEEELSLIDRYINTNSSSALTALTSAFSDKINDMAEYFCKKEGPGYGLDVEDLASEGMLGFILTIPKFDLTSGTRLFSYAKHHIMAHMYQYVMDFQGATRVGTNGNDKTVFQKFIPEKNKLEEEYGQFTDFERKKMAKRLNVPLKVVCRMEHRILKDDISLDQFETQEQDDILASKEITTIKENGVIARLHMEKVISNLNLIFKKLDTYLMQDEAYFIKSYYINSEGISLQDLAMDMFDYERQKYYSVREINKCQISAINKLKIVLKYYLKGVVDPDKMSILPTKTSLPQLIITPGKGARENAIRRMAREIRSDLKSEFPLIFKKTTLSDQLASALNKPETLYKKSPEVIKIFPDILNVMSKKDPIFKTKEGFKIMAHEFTKVKSYKKINPKPKTSNK